MEKFGEIKNNQQVNLPDFLKFYFQNRDSFLRKIRSVAQNAKNKGYEINPEDLIGKQVQELSSQEINLFELEIKKAVREIEKKKRDVEEHWNEEAKRAGITEESEYHDEGGYETIGSGADLRESLKDN